MANPDVTPQMREFMVRNDDAPVRNAVFDKNAAGELVAEVCEGEKAVYVKSSASGDWKEYVRPFA